MTEQSTDQKGIDELSEILSEISDKKTMSFFLKEIMTEKECFDIGLRWKLMQAIYSGESQRKISKDYKISLCKITRGSKILKKEDSCSKKILDNKNKDL
jgi:TrpR family trp operon transcriptional repressor